MSTQDPTPNIALRVEALESLLRDKGLIDSTKVDALIRKFEQDVGPKNGARVVARAWIDPEYRARLLSDGTEAIREFGIGGLQVEHLVAVENTPQVHNVVVCTLCSCYPWGLLGLPPSWYKSPEYRARVVREPRKMLSEMGLELPSEVEIRIWDSSAEIRYLVVPERPVDSESLDEDALAQLVTRDSMIGVAKASPVG